MPSSSNPSNKFITSQEQVKKMKLFKRLQFSFTFFQQQSMINVKCIVLSVQCDQMGKIVCSILSHLQQWNLPKRKIFCKSRFKILSNTKGTMKYCLSLFIFCHIGKIAQNLVTLVFIFLLTFKHDRRRNKNEIKGTSLQR